MEIDINPPLIDYWDDTAKIRKKIKEIGNIFTNRNDGDKGVIPTLKSAPI